MKLKLWHGVAFLLLALWLINKFDTQAFGAIQ
jgi:hypothetical protein